MVSSRRAFLKSSALCATGIASAQVPGIVVKQPVGVRVTQVEFAFEGFKYRMPYKFGGTAVDRVTLLNVTVEVVSPSGKTTKGFGSMPLGNVWSFPSKSIPYEGTLQAMKTLVPKIAVITRAFTESAHPIEINHQLEPEYLKAAADVSQELKLATPIPKLCTQVVASAFDAALHDAFGKSLGVNCYKTYTPELVGHDLSRYLGADFKGESLQSHVTEKPRDWVWLFHSVGGLDAVSDSELKERVNDGMPETLSEWIRRDGLQRIKIKLQGENLAWDIERTVSIDRVARETRPDVEWAYCCDFNEACANVDYVLEVGSAAYFVRGGGGGVISLMGGDVAARVLALPSCEPIASFIAYPGSFHVARAASDGSITVTNETGRLSPESALGPLLLRARAPPPCGRRRSPPPGPRASPSVRDG